MGRHAGLLLGVGLSVIATKFLIIGCFWLDWQRTARRTRR